MIATFVHSDICRARHKVVVHITYVSIIIDTGIPVL